MTPPAVIVAEGIGEIELVAVDDGTGVPPGGTIGQVLTKTGTPDFDTGWEDATGGTGGGITTEQAVDATAAAFAAGTHTNVTVTYNDAANSISLAASGGGGGITTEDALDAVQAAMTGTAPIVVTKSDPANTIVVSATTFGTSAAGVVPASGGGSTNFLRADGTWATPAGGGGGITGITVAEAGTPLDTDITTIDFGAGFDLTETPENEVNVSLDLVEYTGGALQVTGGGTGATTAAAGLANLGGQPLDLDLTTIAGLTATTDNIIQSVAGSWASRTPTQVKSVLALNNVANTTDAAKPVSTATQAALDAKVTNVSGAAGLWAGSQAAYDALGTWSTTTLYIIT